MITPDVSLENNLELLNPKPVDDYHYFILDNAPSQIYITKIEYSGVDHERFYQGNEGAF